MTLPGKDEYTSVQIFIAHKVSNSLDSDQAGSKVGPDLGSNCLQR